jgi:preprotein translocase subunit SecG
MATVILVIHLMIAAALVGIVLIQKSEGGALGIGGGGGGGGGFLTGRGTANVLTRTTAGLAAAFFVTSLTLTILAKSGAQRGSVFDAPAATTTAPPTDGGSQPAAPARGGVLDKLQSGQGGAPLPTVPQSK